MSTSFEVDQFTAPPAWEEFMGRFTAVRQTIGALGLQGATEGEGPALLFGGGALTMNLLDSYIPNGKPFDLDIIVPEAMFSRLGHTGLITNAQRFKQDGFQGIIKPGKNVPLKVDIISSKNPSELSMLVGDEPYTGEPNNSTMTLDGVHVLYPSVVANQKVIYKGNRLKDLAGVVKAHVFATHQEHPILGDDTWTDAVGFAVDRLTENRLQIPLWRKIARRGPAYPSWLRQLIDADFEHPAFATIERT